MMNRTILFLLLTAAVFAFACNNANTNTTANKSTNSNTPAVAQNAKPVADAEIAVLETVDFGKIKIELYSNVAPKMVARFKELANEGFYNGTTFHRVDQTYGIAQGGDPNSKDDNPANDGTGSSGKPNVASEFSDIPYDTGILGAASTAAPDSQNCQFFIMTKRQPAFDKRYTVFGKVIEGQNNVNIIAGAPVAPGSTRPDPKITIKTVTIQKR